MTPAALSYPRLGIALSGMHCSSLGIDRRFALNPLVSPAIWAVVSLAMVLGGL